MQPESHVVDQEQSKSLNEAVERLAELARRLRDQARLNLFLSLLQLTVTH